MFERGGIFKGDKETTQLYLKPQERSFNEEPAMSRLTIGLRGVMLGAISVRGMSQLLDAGGWGERTPSMRDLKSM